MSENGKCFELEPTAGYASDWCSYLAAAKCDYSQKLRICYESYNVSLATIDKLMIRDNAP